MQQPIYMCHRALGGMMAVDVVDNGPMEPVFAQKMRSTGRRARGNTLVWLPGEPIDSVAAAMMRSARIDVRRSKDSLDVREDPASKVTRAFIGEQHTSFSLPHRGVTGKYVVSTLVADTVAHGPVSHNEVGKRVARTPSVVAFVKNYFVVDQVDHAIRRIANFLHR